LYINYLTAKLKVVYVIGEENICIKTIIKLESGDKNENHL